MLQTAWIVCDDDDGILILVNELVVSLEARLPNYLP